MWGLFEGAIQDGLLQGFEGMSVDLVGGKGDKTDLALINFGKANKRFNIGFSMKASMKGETKTGYYGTYTMQRVFELSKIINTQEEYVFDNLIASDKTRLAAARTMNKWIAAKAAWEAVTGGKNDEIYFFVYLNKIITADEMYSSMAAGGESGFKLKIPGVTSIKPMNTKSPIDAFTRSHMVLESIRNMKKVQFTTQL